MFGKKLLSIRRLSTAAIVGCSCLSIQSIANASQASGIAQWTYLVYMVGDNNLEEYVTSDIETELALQGSSDQVQVVTLADRTPGYDTSNGDWTDTKLFHVTEGMKATEDAASMSQGEQNLGDSQTLIDLMVWAKNTYPAEHYAIVFWDHGWGWRPDQSNLDESNDDTLDLDEIAAALDVAGGVDVVGYDACLMQMIEVQASWRPYAKAIVASEDWVDWEGFNHDQVIAALRQNPYMDAEELAINMSESMKDMTVAAVMLDERWDALISAVDRFSIALSNGLGRYRRQYDQAYRASRKYDDYLFRDLRDVAEEIMARVPDAEIQGAGQAVIDALANATVHEWHKSFYDDTWGTAIFWPRYKADLDVITSPTHDFNYYRQNLLFSQLTHWDDFINAYATNAGARVQPQPHSRGEWPEMKR